MHVTRPKPPSEDRLLQRRCEAALLAMEMPSKLGTLIERNAFAGRCLFIHYLVRTGRLRERTS